MSKATNHQSASESAKPDRYSGDAMEVELLVNGTKRTVRVEPSEVLLDTLRDRIQLTGTKKGCDHGQCGACTVLVGGERMNACLLLTASVENLEIVTVEGLARNGELHPAQRAALENDAFQCGYCTPGQVMSLVAMAREPWGDDDDSLREALSGNICRCGAYRNLLKAAKETRRLAHDERWFERTDEKF